jgi:ATP-dependent DNA helicase DinG
VGEVTCLVHSKILQTQYTDDFPEARSLFGRANYDCLQTPGNSCEDCTSNEYSICRHHLAYKKITKNEYDNDLPEPCPYKIQKFKVLSSRYRILNYDYFLSETNYIGNFSGQEFVVIDEADSLENVLIQFVTLTFTKYALRRIGMDEQAGTLKMTSKFKDSLINSWKNFGQTALIRVNAIIGKINATIKASGRDITPQTESAMKELKRIVRLKEKINLFLGNVDDTWMLDNQEDRLIFRPLWLTPEMAEKFLWQHGKKFVLMSASFYPRPILAKTLGLDIDDIDYHMIPSQFPVANRPVYVAPVANLTAKTSDVEIPKLIPAIRSIVDARPNVKGIIHAVSYTLAHRIVDELNDPRYITHNSSDRQETLDRFIQSDDPLILVSPSLERGVSLDEDKARLVIIAKAPYLSLGDKVVSARLYSSRMGSDWYKATMMLTVLQMAGRAVRSATDYAECIILDDQVYQAITSRPGFLPSWWVDACEFRLPAKPMVR